MIEITESIVIEAPCNLAWQTLTDFGAYHLWNSFLIPQSGRFRNGEVMEMKVRPPFEPYQVIEPQFANIAEGKSFSMGGSRLLWGSLSGELTISLEPLELESVRLTQRLVANGFMAQYYVNRLMKTWKFGLSIMNSECKLRSETLFDEALMRASYDTLPSIFRPTLTSLTPSTQSL
ncbi:hypothetical protein KKF84_13810 [Myxococcota bacterium]|nr:hypothetical protein [Myxococcota bacterium]